MDVTDQPPRIGVFICHCGINIGGVVDVPNVVEYVKTLPDVVYAEHNLYTCSADTQTNIKEKIENNQLIQVFKNAQINSISGYIGNFSTSVSYGNNNKSVDLEHGIIVVATGAKEYQPNEYNFGQDQRIITQTEFEKVLFTTDKVKGVKSIIMIQCVGSRNEDHPYCSRICCSEAIKNALKAKEINPNIEIV
ncbi:unnamed protein product, partial [marine sediment metagenome]